MDNDNVPGYDAQGYMTAASVKIMDEQNMDVNNEPVTNEDENSDLENVTSNDGKEINRKRRNGIIKEILSWAVTIIVAFIIASLIRAFVFDHAIVEGRSMENTLYTKQHLIVYKLGYRFSPPHYMDIIMLEYQKGDYKILPFQTTTEVDFIKRVIAVPGDIVDLRGGDVWIKRKGSDTFVKLIEPYAKGKTYVLSAPLTYPLLIPADNVFALGDNRENSSDSRAIGLIPYDRIKGKAIFRIYPFNVIGTLN